jgi:hypothetical protein
MSSDEKENYGEIKKIIQFEDTDRRHAELRLRLHFDGLTQGDFFREIVTGYNQRHPDIIRYIEIVKNHRRKYPKSEKRKVSRSYAKHEDTRAKFKLNKEEIESIFDIIEEEYETI